MVLRRFSWSNAVEVLVGRLSPPPQQRSQAIFHPQHGIEEKTLPGYSRRRQPDMHEEAMTHAAS